MQALSTLEKVGNTVARGVVREEARNFRVRARRSADGFKSEAALKVEGLAGQIRELGRRFDRQQEAHTIARRVERSADYLRFRPTSEVAGDAWRAVRSSPAVWVAGGLLAGFVLYRVARPR